MSNKNIKRAEYKKFFEAQILRPYQDSISDLGKPLKFNRGLYENFSKLIMDNRQWSIDVFNRLAKCIDSIDHDFFPIGKTGKIIMNELESRGVKINHER